MPIQATNTVKIKYIRSPVQGMTMIRVSTLLLCYLYQEGARINVENASESIIADNF